MKDVRLGATVSMKIVDDGNIHASVEGKYKKSFQEEIKNIYHS